MKNKKQAFTLAEVLLVLAIIGVIAAVTIPAIMQQSSEKKFSALAKNTMSTMQNAIDLKIATEPIGPGDMQIDFLEWLVMGDENGTNTLKAVQTNADSSVIQLPNGAIIYSSTTNCTSPTTPTDRFGCPNIWLRIDLNGAEPPTKTTMDNAPNLIGKSWNTFRPNEYDLIRITMAKENGRLIAGSTTENIDKLTKKYLGL